MQKRYKELCEIIGDDHVHGENYPPVSIGNKFMEALSILCTEDAERFVEIEEGATPQSEYMTWACYCYHGENVMRSLKDCEVIWKTRDYDGRNFNEICRTALELAANAKKEVIANNLWLDPDEVLEAQRHYPDFPAWKEIVP